MTKITAKQARQALNQACQHYTDHNQEQLSKVKVDLSSRKERNIYRPLNIPLPLSKPGFISWISYEYAKLFDYIRDLNYECYGLDQYGSSFLYPACKGKITYVIDEVKFGPDFEVPASEYIERFRLLDRLRVLSGLVHHIMIERNKVLNFDERWSDYHKQNYSDIECNDKDFCSIKIQKSLILLTSIFNFLNTLPPSEVKPDCVYLLSQLTKMTPILERFIKGAVVQDLQAILDDTSLTDEAAITSVALHLKDPMVRSILEKDLQSKAEHIFKVLSVILIAVGIGIIPTVILASKRLYDSGGKSMNFFKPLAKQVEGDIEEILAKTIETPVL